MLLRPDILRILEEKEIKYREFTHEAVFTIGEAESLSIPGFDMSRVPKNLFLRDDKKREYYLLSIAPDEKADLLFVHHGLFWGAPIAINGMHYHRVKKALDADMGLFACHIPLDAHPLYGNNAQMALRLGMTAFDPFGTFRGRTVGYKGRLPFPMTAAEISRILGFDEEHGLRTVCFGKDMIESVGIISGGASGDVRDAIAEDLDCYITGEIEHSDFHLVKESNMNVIAGGHYRSEVFGVKAMMRYTEKELGIESFFIDAETLL